MGIFKHLGVFYENRHRSSSIRTLIDLWWYVLLRVLFGLLLLGLIVGGWLLYEAFVGVAPSGEALPLSETLSRSDLANTLNLLEQRRVEYEATIAHPPSIVDPSR